MLEYMDQQRHDDLVARLSDYDVRGVAFADAKTTLLAEGYTEAEIANAIYSAPFDGRDNTKARPPSAVQRIYAASPEAAQNVGDALLEDQAANRRRKLRGLAMQSYIRGPGALNPTALKAEVALADEMGVPYFRILFGLLVAGLVAYKLGVDPEWLRIGMSILLFAYSLFSLYRFIRSQIRRTRRTRIRNDDTDDGPIMRND